MKKVISLALATAVCVSVVACAQSPTTDPAVSTSTVSTAGTLNTNNTTPTNVTSGTTATTAPAQLFEPDMTVPAADENEADTQRLYTTLYIAV